MTQRSGEKMGQNHSLPKSSLEAELLWVKIHHQRVSRDGLLAQIRSNTQIHVFLSTTTQQACCLP